MLIYSIIVTILLIFLISYIFLHNRKTKVKKNIESLFFEDFYDLVPSFNKNNFQNFIKENTFIICIKNNRYDERFRQIPTEKKFVKIFKSYFSADVNIHYKNQNQILCFVLSFDCDEEIIIDSLKKVANKFPTFYIGTSQCLKKEMIYSAIENNLKNGQHKILSSKYWGNAIKAADMGNFNHKNVYRFDVSENKVFTKTSIETESKLITAFNCKKFDETDDIIFSAFENEDNYSQCIHIANNLLALLHNILNKNNTTIGEVYGDNVNLYRWMSGTTHKKGLIEMIQKWYKQAMLYLEEHSDKVNDIELKIEKYIEDNYNKDISITTMADEFGVSNQYFSRYFKSQTGSNFLETLNKYRIKKALEIINDTKLPMTEIATMTGFNNYKSFARNFKKYTGKIPSEYSKK